MKNEPYDNKLLKTEMEDKGILLTSVTVDEMELYPHIPKSYNGRLVIEFTTTGDFSEFDKNELREAILKAVINIKKVHI